MASLTWCAPSATFAPYGSAPLDAMARADRFSARRPIHRDPIGDHPVHVKRRRRRRRFCRTSRFSSGSRFQARIFLPGSASRKVQPT